jgi:hypothetical protein
MQVTNPTSPSAAASAGTRPRRDWGLWAKRGLRLALAALIAAAIVAVAVHALYASFDRRTDIVGYPAFAAFNVDNYTVTYLGWTIAFPLLTLAGYVVLGRVLRPWILRPTAFRGPAYSDAAPVESSRHHPPPSGALTTIASTGAIAAVVGLASTVPLSLHLDWRPEAALVVMASAYVGGALIVAHALAGSQFGPERTREQTLDGLATVNAVAAPLTVLGLGLAARDTHITVITTGAAQWVNWFPWWIAVLIAGGALAVVVRSLRGSDHERRVQVQWLVVVTLVLPVGLVLAVASLPGALPQIDLHHEGEGLAAARMMTRGLVPWKDYLSVHGPLDDGIAELVGLEFIDNSRWGAVAGEWLLWVPLTVLTTFALLAYVLRRRRAALIGAVVVVAAGGGYAGGWLVIWQLRFVLVPVVVLLLALLLRWPRWWLAALLVLTIGTQVMLTLEAGYLIPACALVVAGFEATSAPRPRWRQPNFPRLTWCAISGVVFFLVVAVFLVALGAFDDFFDYFRTFSRDHQLTGGIPVQWNDAGLAIGLFGVPVLIVISFWYAVARTRAGRALELEDWAMGVLVLFLVPYFLKALNRADEPHIRQPWGLAFPLLVYVVARLLASIDLEVARTRIGRDAARVGVASLASVVVVALITGTAAAALVDQVHDTRRDFAPVSLEGPVDHHVGYLRAPVDTAQRMRDARRVFALGGRDATVFDFSNSAAAFYFLLDEESPTRYYHVSTAIRDKSQDDLIEELRAARPDFVVFDNSYGGLGEWDDIPKAIRHYRVSSYLLDHYEPFMGVDGFTILQRGDLGLDPASLLSAFGERASAPLPTGIRDCDWGRVPEFLDDAPAASADARRLATTTASASSALTLPDDLTRYRWLELSNPDGIDEGVIALRQGGDTLTRLEVGPDRPRRLFVRIGSCPQWHWVAQPGPARLVGGGQDLGVRLIR